MHQKQQKSLLKITFSTSALCFILRAVRAGMLLIISVRMLVAELVQAVWVDVSECDITKTANLKLAVFAAQFPVRELYWLKYYIKQKKSKPN